MAKYLKVLLIEDNIDDAELTMRSVRKFGAAFEVEVARDGQCGLDRLMDDSLPLPDMVLLDLKLPKIGGLEILKRLRQSPRTSELAVIALSAEDEPVETRAVHEKLASGYLNKPVTALAFGLVIDRLGF